MMAFGSAQGTLASTCVEFFDAGTATQAPTQAIRSVLLKSCRGGLGCPAKRETLFYRSRLSCQTPLDQGPLPVGSAGGGLAAVGTSLFYRTVKACQHCLCRFGSRSFRQGRRLAAAPSRDAYDTHQRAVVNTLWPIGAVRAALDRSQRASAFHQTVLRCSNRAREAVESGIGRGFQALMARERREPARLMLGGDAGYISRPVDAAQDGSLSE